LAFELDTQPEKESIAAAQRNVAAAYELAMGDSFMIASLENKVEGALNAPELPRYSALPNTDLTFPQFFAAGTDRAPQRRQGRGDSHPLNPQATISRKMWNPW
jgi:hypothetical protein